MLCIKFQNEGFVVKQAEEYADYLVIKSTLEIEKRSQCVVVVVEDIDLLVLIAASTNSENIFFLKPGRAAAREPLSVRTYRFNIVLDLPKGPYIGVGKKPNMDCSQSPPTRNQLLQLFSL
ncbi:hypothetical protein AVEN_79219-1 [Araneus ventricosus]|uniref:Uncharacterized protein n=1 Tax=Araneus ventricosus TaxID=182803 RepID=A0A4Y2KNT7_ARAVE|nr:hypothetical protein AVEN_79219-1 [Araneus ventricosus]